MFTKDDVIFAYTRAQAIADGVLIDVSATAREAGFVYPVALTAGAWAACVAVPPGAGGQDEAGRLWDVLTVLRARAAGRRGRPPAAEVRFRVHVRTDDRAGAPPGVELRAVCGPDDDGRPCVTVLLPHED